MMRRLGLLVIPLVAAVAACGGSGSDSGLVLNAQAKSGQTLYQSKSCHSCHTTNGDRSEAPTFKGLYGSTVTLKDGSTVTADDAYLARSMRDPSGQLVKGYGPLMPKTQLSDDEVAALIAYIKAAK